MFSKVFINLPVADLSRSNAFYSALGWELQPGFSNDDASSFKISEDVYLMALTHDHYRSFTTKPITDAGLTSGVINALSLDSSDDVDEVARRAVGAGATENAPQELGFMRSRSFDDPDGHTWEVFWMDPIAQTGDWAAVQEKYPPAE